MPAGVPMKARLQSLTYDRDGKPLLTVSVPPEAVELFDDLHDADVSIEIKRWRQKRSLDANAYFHVLVNMIAAKLAETDPEPPTNDDVKRQLVIDYGTLEKDDEGNLVGAKLPASANIFKYFPYAKAYKETEENGRTYVCYMFYKRTHELDSKEMSKLISGAVKEAKQLGLETLTPKELEALGIYE